MQHVKLLEQSVRASEVRSLNEELRRQHCLWAPEWLVEHAVLAQLERACTSGEERVLIYRACGNLTGAAIISHARNEDFSRLHDLFPEEAFDETALAVPVFAVSGSVSSGPSILDAILARLHDCAVEDGKRVIHVLCHDCDNNVCSGLIRAGFHKQPKTHELRQLGAVVLTGDVA